MKICENLQYKGFSSNLMDLTYLIYSVNSIGWSLHKYFIVVLIFSYINLCLSSFCLALASCHGNFPFKKYIKIYDIYSRSSLLPCLIPLC